MARKRGQKVDRATTKGNKGGKSKGEAAARAEFDKAVIKIKSESKSDGEAAARIKRLQAKYQLLHGNRPVVRLGAPLTVDGIKVTRIEVLLPPGFDASNLPPHGGDPADGDIGDPASKGPPYDTDSQDPEDTDGL